MTAAITKTLLDKPAVAPEFCCDATHRRRRGIDDGPQRRGASHATFADAGKNNPWAGHLNSQHPAKCAFASITPQFPMATCEYAKRRDEFLEQFLATLF